ncbi:cytochrome P450 [Suillus ampliporus]|nr:cytochrome P450 [Suillus ampliporus]
MLLQAVVDIMETQGVSLKAAEAYQPLQMSHAKDTVLDILDDPCNFQNHVTSYAATTITKITYGRTTPTSATDPDVEEVRQHVRNFGLVLRPGAYLVELIPWLRYLPWYGQELRREYEKSRKLYTKQLNRVKQQLQSNVDIGPSFAKHMLENDQLYNSTETDMTFPSFGKYMPDKGHLCGLTETEMAFLAGAFFAAGSDTTAVTIRTVFMAAACFPEEQAKVQAELDAVIGRHQAPTFDDQKSLPHLEAFISEALRRRPITPNAGTTVFGNPWAISRDPEVFPEPYVLKSQRRINEQGGLRDDLKFFVYGFGRRLSFVPPFAPVYALRTDPTKPLEDMGFMEVSMPDGQPCPIKLQTRVPDTDLRHMMQNYPEVA